MTPGRELDVLVAEKVMGIKCPAWVSCGRGRGVWEQTLPRYSTDIAAAWEVVEKLQSRFNAVEVRQSRYKAVDGSFVDEYEVTINPHGWLGQEQVFRTGKSAAHTICLAALPELDDDCD